MAAVLLFCTRPNVEPLLAPYQLGNNGNPAEHFLLLDCETRWLYVGKRTAIEDCLSHPESLNLMAALDSPSTQRWSHLDQYLQSFKRSLLRLVKDKKMLFVVGVPVIALGIYVLDGAGDFIFDALELWDD